MDVRTRTTLEGLSTVMAAAVAEEPAVAGARVEDRARRQCAIADPLWRMPDEAAGDRNETIRDGLRHTELDVWFYFSNQDENIP